jgi:hypothetical protein
MHFWHSSADHLTISSVPTISSLFSIVPSALIGTPSVLRAIPPLSSQVAARLRPICPACLRASFPIRLSRQVPLITSVLFPQAN